MKELIQLLKSNESVVNFFINMFYVTPWQNLNEISFYLV